jgi:hypothetical protein
VNGPEEREDIAPYWSPEDELGPFADEDEEGEPDWPEMTGIPEFGEF